MSRRLVIPTVFSLYLAGTAMATITEWGEATDGFEINENAHTIKITAPGTYYFQSITSGNPDYIQWVSVDSEIAAGTVTVTVG